MAMSKFTLRVCTFTILLTMLVASGVYAGEPWSTDLWTVPAPSNNGSNTGTNQNGGSGGGLWSDQLWQTTPAGQQPTPPIVENPKDSDKISAILVMQVANNKALVHGVQKELVVPPTNINGRMMLPLRFIAEELKATFTWSNAERKTTIKLDGKTIELWNGKSSAKVNGTVVQLDTPPVVLDGSTLVPIRFVSENFGYVVHYEAATQTVKIGKQEKTSSKTEPETKAPTLESKFNYFGVWELRMDGFANGLLLGTLTVNKDGTYEMKHGINGTAIGKWRQGAKDEVIGIKDALILEKGPAGLDWVMVPKSDGLVGVRYHYGYDIQTKIWFEDSLGIQIKK